MLSAKGYAGFWKRFVAYIIDAVILSAILFVIDSFMPGDSILATNPEAVNTNMGGASILVSWLYFALQESSQKQATVGKLALGIAVTDLAGKRISFLRASGRHFAKIISGVIIGIGYLMAAFTARKQGLHDMIAGTLVMNK